MTYQTRCECCSQPLCLQVDSDLGYRVDDDASPLVCIPIVDFAKLEDPTIIDAF